LSNEVCAPADEDLARRIAAGDRAAEDELVDRFGNALFFVLRRWTRDRTTAEDLYQETFRLGLEKIRQQDVRRPERLGAFLRGLARNLSIQHYRPRTMREEHLESAYLLQDREPGQLSRLMRQEKEALVHEVLEELPSDRDRQALFRFYIAEEEKESICADLRLSGSQFNLVLHRARQRYRALFEQRVSAGEV
jgi:RNA polymerase sigma-70 factor (ECF subfamily)